MYSIFLSAPAQVRSLAGRFLFLRSVRVCAYSQIANGNIWLRVAADPAKTNAGHRRIRRAPVANRPFMCGGNE
jgi:hypothetical protein